MPYREVPPEKRQFGRRQMYKHGWVRIPGRPPLTCTIRNLSDGGALLEFQREETLPYHFMLTIEGTNDVRGCEVRHAYGRSTGVAFVDVASIQTGSASYGGEVGTWVEPQSHLTRR